MSVLRTVTTAVFSLALVGVAFSPAAKADEWNDKTVMTFSAPVEIPGVHLKGWGVLPAGTYVFKLLDSQSDRHIVQIFNKDETVVYATDVYKRQSREFHQDVIGLHGRDLARVRLVGKHPEVLAVIVDLRNRHMECCVLVGLDGEKILRIPQMHFQICRKPIQVLEYARKRTPVNRQNGVVRIHDVEPDGSVVHVHNHLDGVANVVQPLLKGRGVRAGVGIVIREGVSILDPVQFALAHHCLLYTSPGLTNSRAAPYSRP